MDNIKTAGVLTPLCFCVGLVFFTFDLSAQQKSGEADKAKQSNAKATSSFKVFSALRTQSWRPYPGGPELTPNSADEVVLWVQVQDVPDDWYRPKVMLYLQAGERRFEYMTKSVSVYRSAGSPPLHHAAFLVPKDALEMGLVLGAHPIMKFRADQRILPSIDASAPPK
jgi:hypothetical protein